MPETTEQQPANTKPKQSAYLVCEGAQCKCLGGGDIRAKLKVDSHKKAYINNNKLLATVKDITFEEGPKPFTSCSLATSQDKSCTPKFEKWQKPYKDIEVEGNQVITDQSELMCLTWKGIVSIDTHGQKQDVSEVQANNVDRNMAMQVNPLADFVPLNLDITKKVEVKSISGALIDDPKYKSVTNQQIAVVKSAKKDDPADMYVRPAQEVEFKSTYTGEASLVCWKIADAKGPMHFLQHGPVYKTSLPEAGKYTIEGYGTGGDNNLDIDTKIAKNKDTGKSEFIKRNPDRSCRLDILVQVNKLTGIRHVSSDNVVAGKVDDKAGVHVRIGVPVTFEPVYLMPPNQEEIDHLILLIKDASGNEVQRAKGKPNIIFAAQNSAAVYSVEAYFDNSDAKPFIYPFKTAANTISVIAASGLKKENDKIRPGTTLTFSVSQFKFENDEVQEELIQAELANIKWYDNADTPAATGTTTYSNIYQREGKYVVTCAVTTKSAGWFTTKKNEADDWHFEVTRNYPTAIEQKTEGKVKVGKKVVFEMKSIFDVIYADEKTIHWELSGPESMTLARLSVFVFTPKQKGKYILKVTMNGKTKEFSFECIACEIVQGWWTDGDGNILTGNNAYNEPNNTIGFAGWGQEVVATFKHVGLKGEEVTLEVWDSDLTSNTSVFTKDIKIEDDYSVGCAITLDEKIKTKVKEKGFSSDGTLYFTVKAKNGLNIINSGMSLPENGKFLNVDSTARVRAYFSDNNDTRRYSTAALDTPVYMQIKSTNMIGEELEVELWSLNSSLSPLASRFTFTVDKYGMASLKLNMKAIEPKLPTDKDSIMVYLDIYHKKTGHRYFTGSDKPKLTMYRRLLSSPSSIGTTKAFVVVDVSGGENKQCGCKLNNFAWGNRLTCQERKKVLSICSKLWGDVNKIKRASELMSIIHLESAGTFNPSIDNGFGYSGLIQFSDDAAKLIGTTRMDLKKMTFIQQLDYVEKYLYTNKDKLNTMTDLYLLVLKPSAVGNGGNQEYIVFDESISVPDVPFNKDNLYKEPWTTKFGYTSNPIFMIEEGESTKRLHKTYSKGEIMRPGFINGKTYVREITEVLHEQHYKNGMLNIFSGFCEDETKNRNDISLKNRAPWMIIAVSKAEQIRGCKESDSPMYSMAKEYLKYCGNTFEPTDSDNGPWCAAFMNWCIGQSINPVTKRTYNHSKSASSLAPIDSELGLNYSKIENPIFGCIVVYKHISDWKGHTGFLYGKTESGDYILLGGNQDDTIRFDSYGEYTSSTKNKKIYGFYIPKDYEVTDYDKLTNLDIYKDAEVVNSKYKIVSIKSTGKTN